MSLRYWLKNYFKIQYIETDFARINYLLSYRQPTTVQIMTLLGSKSHFLALTYFRNLSKKENVGKIFQQQAQQQHSDDPLTSHHTVTGNNKNNSTTTTTPPLIIPWPLVVWTEVKREKGFTISSRKKGRYHTTCMHASWRLPLTPTIALYFTAASGQRRLRNVRVPCSDWESNFSLREYIFS